MIPGGPFEPGFLAFVAGGVGLVLGSFLNVLSLRWPTDRSIVRPGSHCPACETPIRWFDNVPLLSWIVLRGRCRDCGVRISVQYPLVELGTALIWAGMAWHEGMTVEALRGAVFLTILFGIALADARFYIIPNPFSVGGMGVGLAFSGFSPRIGLVESASGAAVGFALLWGVAWAGTRLFRRQMEAAGVDQAMGGGDIKMMAMVGAFLGIPGVLLTLFLGSVLGVVVFGPISAMTRRLIPFGVFLAAGAALTWAWGGALVEWYLGKVLGVGG